jgi:hypothetical protein
VLFLVSPHLIGFQVVVEVAQQEQGAIEPHLLFGPGIETILEGREHVRKKKIDIYLAAHVAHPSPRTLSSYP